MFTNIRGAVLWPSPRLLLAMAVVLAALASGYGLSQVRASHTDPNEVHLCVSNYTGQVRYVQNPAHCTGGFVVTVNQQGVPGPEGPEGPQGSQGPPGGVAGYERVVEEVVIPPGTLGQVAATADCGEKLVLSGGIRDFSLGTYWKIDESYPIGDHLWRVAVSGDSLEIDTAFYVYAICADAG